MKSMKRKALLAVLVAAILAIALVILVYYPLEEVTVGPPGFPEITLEILSKNETYANVSVSSVLPSDWDLAALSVILVNESAIVDRIAILQSPIAYGVEGHLIFVDEDANDKISSNDWFSIVTSPNQNYRLSVRWIPGDIEVGEAVWKSS